MLVWLISRLQVMHNPGTHTHLSIWLMLYREQLVHFGYKLLHINVKFSAKLVSHTLTQSVHFELWQIIYKMLFAFAFDFAFPNGKCN